MYVPQQIETKRYTLWICSSTNGGACDDSDSFELLTAGVLGT